MDVYVMVNGQNPQKEQVLKLLGLDEETVIRFRDCGIDFEEKVLWIFTRTGSKNFFGKSNKLLENHNLYLRKYDDSFDSTYELLLFTVPPFLNLINIKHYPIPDLEKVVSKGVEDLNSGNINEATKLFAKQLEQKIKNSDNRIISFLDER
jgi:hypothetical protein